MNQKKIPPPPSAHVLQMFDVHEVPTPLHGGEGNTFRAGNIVLKPALQIELVEKCAAVLSTITEDGFRVNRPVRTIDGKWTCEGWQAFYFLEGVHVKGRWKEKIDISIKFHRALQKFPLSDFIAEGNSPWEVADRVVWNGTVEEYGEKVRPITDRLLAVKTNIDIPSQLIHGDMTGNILFHETLSPAIIDFSPYIRPAAYATAIIVVDAVVWEGAQMALLSEMENTHLNNQLLIRAALWRIRTTDEFSRRNQSDPTSEVTPYSHFVDGLLRRIASEQSA